MTESGEAMPAIKNWSVIRTRPRWEKKVAQLLTQKGIETFCPLVKARHQWSDRVKTVEKPLLKSYVFVKVGEDQRTDVRLTEGVMNFVYRNGRPVVVKEKLVQGIQQFQGSHSHVAVLAVPETAGNGLHPEAAKGRQPSLWIEALDLVLVSCPVPSDLIETTTDKL